MYTVSGTYFAHLRVTHWLRLCKSTKSCSGMKARVLSDVHGFPCVLRAVSRAALGQSQVSSSRAACVQRSQNHQRAEASLNVWCLCPMSSLIAYPRQRTTCNNCEQLRLQSPASKQHAVSLCIYTCVPISSCCTVSSCKNGSMSAHLL